jgi:hypothetical protein
MSRTRAMNSACSGPPTNLTDIAHLLIE